MRLSSLTPYSKCSGIVTPESISINSTLLSPPDTPIDENEIPFKPTDADRNSLNMKKRRKRRTACELHRSCSDLTTSHDKLLSQMHSSSFEHRELGESQSMPSVLAQSSFALFSDIRRRGTNKVDFGGKTTRRWTLPSKASATCGVTTLKSTINRAASAKDSESPAMITLRRATSSTHPSQKKSSITFFPEPLFGGDRPRLLSYLTNTFSGAGKQIGSTRNFSFFTLLYKANAVSGCRDFSMAGTTAPLVQTEVNMACQVPTSTLRRCSTKYMSDNSMYEVIWDENDISSADTEASPHLSTGSPKQRQRSIAIEQLELQLLKTEDASRRNSSDAALSSRKLSISMRTGTQERKHSMFEALQLNLGRLLSESRMQNLPRSLTGKSFNAMRQSPRSKAAHRSNIEEICSQSQATKVCLLSCDRMQPEQPSPVEDIYSEQHHLQGCEQQWGTLTSASDMNRNLGSQTRVRRRRALSSQDRGCPSPRADQDVEAGIDNALPQVPM